MDISDNLVWKRTCWSDSKCLALPTFRWRRSGGARCILDSIYFHRGATRIMRDRTSDYIDSRMTPSLFPAPTQYGAPFEEIWSRYRGPKNQKKPDAYKAYKQAFITLPSHDIVLYCIDDYRDDIRKRKCLQQHLATWLRGKVWEGYLDDAILRKRIADHPELIPKPRPSFTASQHSAPEAATSLKPWKEVLAKHRGEMT